MGIWKHGYKGGATEDLYPISRQEDGKNYFCSERTSWRTNLKYKKWLSYHKVLFLGKLLLVRTDLFLNTINITYFKRNITNTHVKNVNDTTKNT
jgi:hypothetical protein